MQVFRKPRHAIHNGSLGRTQQDAPCHAHRQFRRGALIVEAAIVMIPFLMLTLGAIDLQIAVYRHNTLAQAARCGVRQAIVHGALSAPAMTAWGPAVYSGTASDGSQYANAVQPMLVGFSQNNVAITVEWPDGSNAVGKRVRYTLSTPYQPLLGVLIGYSTFTLKAASTMPITH